MPMNEVILSRRRALGMTQEQLAERLGVTAPAVNKWEKGATCPDLMLLSPLARLLGVDLNERLCFHADLSEEQLARCLEEVRESFEREGLEAGFALARARMREYPRCAQLAEQLTLFLNAALFWSEADGAARAAYNAELKGWYAQLLNCAEGEIRARAAQMLASLRLQEKEYDEAERLLELIPEPPQTDAALLKETLLSCKGELDAAGKLAAQSALRAAGKLQSHLQKLVEVELKQQNFERAEAIAASLRAMVDALGLWAYNAPVAELSIALAREDAPRSISLLRELLEATLAPWNVSESPAFCRLGGQNPPPRTTFRMTDVLLRALEQEEQYAFLHADPACAALISEYRARIEPDLQSENSK